MTLLEVAKHALEAMEDAMYRADTHEFYDAKESLRYAIEQAEQAEQEPVAWIQKTAVDWLTTTSSSAYIITTVMKNTDDEAYVPLYTAPTPRKPLTDEEMRECAQAMNAEPLAEGWPELIKFARAIENKHGIGEQHE